MIKKTKEERYLEYLDRILAGDLENREVEDIEVEDKEVEKLLKTAKSMLSIDLSIKSNIRDQLRSKLIALLSSIEETAIKK